MLKSWCSELEIDWPIKKASRPFGYAGVTKEGRGFLGLPFCGFRQHLAENGPGLLRTLSAFIITLDTSAFIRPAFPGVESSSSGEEGVHDVWQSKVR